MAHQDLGGLRGGEVLRPPRAVFKSGKRCHISNRAEPYSLPPDRRAARRRDKIFAFFRHGQIESGVLYQLDCDFRHRDFTIAALPFAANPAGNIGFGRSRGCNLFPFFHDAAQNSIGEICKALACLAGFQDFDGFSHRRMWRHIHKDDLRHRRLQNGLHKGRRFFAHKGFQHRFDLAGAPKDGRRDRPRKGPITRLQRGVILGRRQSQL